MSKKTARELTLGALAWPIFVEQALRILIGTVDTFMVSHVSDGAVAALGVATQVVIMAIILFIFIGAKPHTDFVAGVLERTDEGFIITGEDLFRDGRRPKNWTLKRDPYLLETNVPGIFAAGDVRHGTISRIASAVGQGGQVVSFVEQYLKTV